MIHLKRADYVCSKWSGGETTQIAIAPQGAVYAERSFLWRVSSASVELEESDFTPLPDYMRYIATLKGEMTLTHDGGMPIRLQPFDVHCFDGASDTHSIGRCTDFNLMLRKGVCRGTLTAIRLQSGEVHELTPKGDMVVFCASGAAAANGEALCCGESILAQEHVCIRAARDAVLMCAEIEKI